MLFTTPLLSLTLATLAAAQEPPKAVFYLFNNYQGPSFTIDVSSDSSCHPRDMIGFTPESATISEGVQCFLYVDGGCRVISRLLTSETDNSDLPYRQGSLRCELIPKF